MKYFSALKSQRMTQRQTRGEEYSSAGRKIVRSPMDLVWIDWQEWPVNFAEEYELFRRTHKVEMNISG